MQPYRVLLVNLARGYGGAETRVLSQACSLQSHVARCAVAVASGSPLHERLRREGAPCEVITTARTDPRLLNELARVIRRGSYNVVDAHNIHSLFWAHLAALVGGARGRVTTMHSDYAEEYTGMRRVLYPAVARIMRPVTRQYVQVTPLLQEKAEAAGDGARSTVISNAVAVPTEPPQWRDAALLEQWGWSADDFVVAVLGRLYPVKGQLHLIDAMALLHDRPRVRLLVAGDGPLRAELEARAHRLGLGARVHFAGFRQDVTAILQTVDCVCLPSLWEILPYAVLEAAACARPIVATAVGGVPRVLQDGETALLVPPRDPAALAAALRRLVDAPDEARSMGLAAYAMVRRSFSADELVQRTLDVYSRALA
jgi:glycosyltransferase involved in cell wall biosynthesis